MIEQFYLTHKWDSNLVQSKPRSSGNEKLLHIPQSSRSGDSLSNVFSVIPQTLDREGSYTFAEVQSAYSTAPVNKAAFTCTRATIELILNGLFYVAQRSDKTKILLGREVCK